MIDFVSTREGIDQNTRISAQFLAGIVASFLRQASEAPARAELEHQANSVLGCALGGIWYLFSPDSAAEDHMEHLGGNIFTVRGALLGQAALGVGPCFTDEHRQNIQTRHAWWVAAGQPAPTTAGNNEHIPRGETA